MSDDPVKHGYPPEDEDGESAVPAETDSGEAAEAAEASGKDADGKEQAADGEGKEEETEALAEMGLLEHLEELRKRVTRCLIAVGVGFLASYGFSKQLFDLLMAPMVGVLKTSKFIYTYPPEAFFTYIKVSIVAGIFLVSPYLFYQVWKFVAPGLYEEERKGLVPIALCSAVFFISGALFGYYIVFPFGFEFFASFTTEEIQFMPKLSEYLGFSLKLLFAFGLVFELPLFIFFLARLGLVTSKGLRKKRKYAILVAFVMAALLTPPDPFTQSLMAGPLIILYEMGIWVAYFFGKKDRELRKEKRQAKKEAKAKDKAKGKGKEEAPEKEAEDKAEKAPESGEKE